METLQKNIKHYRKQSKLTQFQLSKSLNISGNTISNWESGVSTPPLESIILMSKIFGTSLDELILNDNNRIVKPPFTQKEDEKIIIKPKNLFVPIRAQAGYMAGWSDENLNEGLEYVNIPGLPKDMEARTFEVIGTSMYPKVLEGDYLVCTKVERNQTFNADAIHVIITKFNGLMVKTIHFREDEIILSSYNSYEFPPINIPLNEVIEIWQARFKITRSFSNGQSSRQNQDLSKRIDELENLITQKLERL